MEVVFELKLKGVLVWGWGGGLLKRTEKSGEGVGGGGGVPFFLCNLGLSSGGLGCEED